MRWQSYLYLLREGTGEGKGRMCKKHNSSLLGITGGILLNTDFLITITVILINC